MTEKSQRAPATSNCFVSQAEQRQFHARKHNCYFWVFQKSARHNYRPAQGVPR